MNLTLNEFESKLSFELEAKSDQQGVIKVIEVKSNELLGTFDIEAENVEELEAMKEQCKLDHYNFMNQILKHDIKDIERVFDKIAGSSA